MKAILYISVFICFISCEKSAVTQELEKNKEKESFHIVKEDISKLNYIEFVLDVKAEKALDSWQKYHELDDIVSNVNNADLSFFKENNEILIAFIKDLKSSIPELINTPLIEARVLALETKMLKLEGILNLSSPQKKELLATVREFLFAFSNLNLQINKKFERDSQNIQKPH